MSGERKLVMLFPVMNDFQKAQLAERADKYGFEVALCDNISDALKEAADAEIVFGLNKALAKAGPNIRWVATPSAGVDHFLSEVAGTDILLTNSSGAYGVTIAEHIIMTTIELMRRRMEYIGLARQRIWEQGLPVRSIYGSRVTLVGTGDIGVEAAKRLRAFEPESITGVNRRGVNPDGIFDRIVTISEIDSVLPETDLLILSLPSTKETRGLLTEERLRLLPESAYIVNVGRGDVLDEKALEKMLREGQLGGAALDVFEKEPLTADSTLWDCPRLVMTTHVAGNWTLQHTVDRIFELFLEDFENYCEGRPLKQRVDTAAGY